ncbi:VOC family protein [Streptomyces mirabilis]|uniref:VOC family protein n=1 Tax=Streptomyces mirabilis TaxID=68239 RepID=UPI003F4CEAE3
MSELLWDDVAYLFDPDLMGSLPDVCVPDTSMEYWQVVLDLIGESGWKCQYSEGDAVLPVGPVSEARSGGADSGGCKDVAMEQILSRQEASEAVHDYGWRFLLGTLRTSVRVRSLAQAMGLAADTVAVCGDDADRHLRVDVRPDRVVFTLQSLDRAAVTTRDVELARQISATADRSGLLAEPEIGTGASRSVQLLEIAIDALNIAGIRPFWKAVLGYTDEAGAEGPEDPLIDPVGQGPAIWFQQMDRARPQRNRIHFDICVPHDEAPRRIETALAAGGRLVSATRAPAFWVLADLEGNEACVTTWQGREG